jgi:hypothetical protein
MIFKVYQPLTGKWFYYDNICLAKENFVVLGNRPLDEDEVNLLPEERDAQQAVRSIDLIFINGRVKTIYFQDRGFLMNDEGKTIERL